MNKIIVALMMLVLVGCSTSSGGTTKAEQQPLSQPQTTEQQATKHSEESEQSTYSGFFRNVNFGMSRDDVIAAEDVELVDKSNHLQARTEICGHPGLLMYFFTSDGLLSEIGVIYDEQHLDDIIYFGVYDSYVSALTEKYGDPDINSDIWYDEYYKDNPRSNSMRFGHMSKVASWETDEYEIFAKAGAVDLNAATIFKISSTEHETAAATSGF